MSESHAEEIIGCLWIGLGFLALSTYHEWWAAMFFTKGVIDEFLAIWFATKDVVGEENNNAAPQIASPSRRQSGTEGE